jgi:hypothetical protein
MTIRQCKDGEKIDDQTGECVPLCKEGEFDNASGKCIVKHEATPQINIRTQQIPQSGAPQITTAGKCTVC